VNIHLLEDVERKSDGRLRWTFVVQGDLSGPPRSPHVIGATRLWQVVPDASLHAVVHEMRAPRVPDIQPDPELEHELRRRVHEELVRGHLAALVATPRCRTKETAA
jgi:hypothetical protein